MNDKTERRPMRVRLSSESSYHIGSREAEEELARIINALDDRLKATAKITENLKNPRTGETILAEAERVHTMFAESISIFFGQAVPALAIGIRRMEQPNSVGKFRSDTAIVEGLDERNLPLLEQLAA